MKEQLTAPNLAQPCRLLHSRPCKERQAPWPLFGLLKTPPLLFFFLGGGGHSRATEAGAASCWETTNREYGGVKLVSPEGPQALLTVKPSLQPLSVFNFNSIFSRWSLEIPISAASSHYKQPFQT